jgi:hypothetical protein
MQKCWINLFCPRHSTNIHPKGCTTPTTYIREQESQKLRGSHENLASHTLVIQETGVSSKGNTFSTTKGMKGGGKRKTMSDHIWSSKGLKALKDTYTYL